MGLYLMILDADEVQTYDDFMGFEDDVEEAESLDVGAYSDFGAFRDAVAVNLEGGSAGSLFPTLMNHSDSDGLWSASECVVLLGELEQISSRLAALPRQPYPSSWMEQIAEEAGLPHDSLRESFVAVGDELLIDGLLRLARAGVSLRRPILFQ